MIICLIVVQLLIAAATLPRRFRQYLVQREKSFLPLKPGDTLMNHRANASLTKGFTLPKVSTSEEGNGDTSWPHEIKQPCNRHAEAFVFDTRCLRLSSAISEPGPSHARTIVQIWGVQLLFGNR